MDTEGSRQDELGAEIDIYTLLMRVCTCSVVAGMSDSL